MKNRTDFITKIFLTKTFAVLMLIGMMNSLSFAQTRVRFARGKSSATVSGTLSNGYQRSYIVGARRGQKMTVRVRGNGNLWLDIGGNDVGTGETIELRSTDDYIITVHNDDDARVRYSLYISIR
jgi:hypothetical protein